MRKAKLILALAVVALFVSACWQIAACVLANVELADDMRDLSAQLGPRIGLNPPSLDEELRSTVIRKAKQHGIELEPKQVVVQRSGDPAAPDLYLAAQYDGHVNLLGYSFTLHFTPSSRNKGL